MRIVKAQGNPSSRAKSVLSRRSEVREGAAFRPKSSAKLRKLEENLVQRSTVTLLHALGTPQVGRVEGGETLVRSVADSQKTTNAHMREKSRSLSPKCFPTAVRVKNDSMLQTQLDLTHTLIQELIERKETALANFERLTATPETSAVEGTTGSLTQSLTARKWKKVAARRNAGREDVISKIREIMKSPSSPPVSDVAAQLFYCLPAASDLSYDYSPWQKVLKSIETLTPSTAIQSRDDLSSDFDIKTALFSLRNLQSRIEKAPDDEKIALDEEDFLQMLEEVTRAYRLLVKKVSEPAILEGFDVLWQVNCFVFDYFVTINSQKVARVYTEIQKQVDKEQAKLKQVLKQMSEQWQARLEEERRQSAKAAVVIERLQQEKAAVVELLKDRETEISEIRHPHEMRDFENVVADLGQYLEDMESRHEAQSKLLDSISELINKKNLKKHLKRRDELGYSIIKQVLTGSRTEFAFGIRKKAEGSNPDAEGKVSRPRAFSTPHNLLRTRSMTSAKKDVPPSVPHFHTPIPPIPSIPEAPLTSTSELTGELDTSTDSEETTDEIGVQTDPWAPALSPTAVILAHPQKRRRPAKRVGLLALVTDEMKRQPPMLNSNVFKLFEIAMLEKLKSDFSEEEQGRNPKSMADFMLDFLFMQQGLKTLVIKSLGALLNALEGLAAKKHPYGTLFCRVLNVFADRPFDNQLNSFLVRARAEFAELQKGYKSIPSKAEMEIGGSAQLVDVAEKLIALFPSYKSIAYEVMERLELPNFTEFDKSCMLFFGKLHKVGRDFKLFFIHADPQKSGVLDDSAFVSCAQDAFGICLSRARLLEIFRFLTQTKLRYSDIQKLPFKDWVGRAQSKQANVSKCSFLSTIAEVYWSEEEKLREKLKKAYEQMREGVRHLLDFQDLVTEVEDGIPAETIVQLYREALDVSADSTENQDLVTKDAFCEVGVKYRLGCEGLRAFSSGVAPLQYALHLQSTLTPFQEDPDSP